MLLLGALAAVVAVAFVTPAGGGESPHTRRSAAGATVSVEYPREVRVADLPDSVVRRTALAADPPVTVLVELAPGVRRNRGPGPLGTLDDYTAVFGECRGDQPVRTVASRRPGLLTHAAPVVDASSQARRRARPPSRGSRDRRHV